MKTFAIHSLTAILLFATASAQELTPEQQQKQIELEFRAFQSPKRQLEDVSEKLAAFRAPWEGYGTVGTLRLAMRLIGADELGLSEVQKERLPFTADGDGMKDAPYQAFYSKDNTSPELAQARKELISVLIPDDPLLERATEKQKDAILEADTKIELLFQKTLQAAIEETLTPEQMREVKKLEIQLMPQVGIPFPTMFEILDLTDEQKKEMDKIVSEIKPEYDRLIKEFIMLEIEEMYSMRRNELKGKTFDSLEELHKCFGEIHRRRVMANPDGGKRGMEFMDRGTRLATLMQDRMMNVLTDEQLVKMQEILDATPMAVKKMLATIKMMQTAAKLSPTYVPGPDSWRPCMPVPKQFMEERKARRFPRSEN